MSRGRGTRDAFGGPAAAGSEQDTDAAHGLGTRIDDLVLRMVPRVVRGVLIALCLGLSVFGLLIGVGAFGEADITGFGMFVFGLSLAFIVWKRVWGALADLLIP